MKEEIACTKAKRWEGLILLRKFKNFNRAGSKHVRDKVIRDKT